MNRDEWMKDWFVRYHMILGRRYTKKQKMRFLQSATADIRQFRPDIELDSFKLHEGDKQKYHNLYVGNIKTADKVICTYYDTPAIQLGSYHFFDVEHRKRSTMTWIGIFSLLFIVVGLIYTLFVAIPVFQANGIWNFFSLLSVLGYLVYFYFLNRVTRGWPTKKNLVRNTSSVLLLLDCIYSCKNKKVAFAFLDAGCTNSAGLDQMMGENKASIYMLDSIGSTQPLYQVAKRPTLFIRNESIESAEPSFKQSNRLLYLISGKREIHSFLLLKEDLKSKQINEVNMNIAYDFLKEVMRGN